MQHERLTKDFIKIMEENSWLKELMQESLEIGKRINPDKLTNPAQSLEELYDFLD